MKHPVPVSVSIFLIIFDFLHPLRLFISAVLTSNEFRMEFLTRMSSHFVTRSSSIWNFAQVFFLLVSPLKYWRDVQRHSVKTSFLFCFSFQYLSLLSFPRSKNNEKKILSQKKKLKRTIFRFSVWKVNFYREITFTFTLLCFLL